MIRIFNHSEAMMISTQELADSLKVTPQRISALNKTCGIMDQETVLRGRTRFYTRNAVKKLFQYRGLDYSFRQTVAISNNKGGVGKTSIATTLARRLTGLGYEVLVIDIDPQANTTSFFLNTDELQSQIRNVLFDVIRGEATVEASVIKVEEGLSILPSSLLNSRIEAELTGTKRNPASFISNLLKNVKSNFIIFDMSPSFSSINFLASLASDMMIVPTLLTRFSVEGVQMTLDSILEWKDEYSGYDPEIRILVNQMDSRLSSSLGYGGILKEAENNFRAQGLKASLFKAVIRADNSINRVQSGSSELSTTSNFYKDIAQLADEISGIQNLKPESSSSYKPHHDVSL